MSNTNKKERFLRLSDVMMRTGLSRSAIYLYIGEGSFPSNINLSTRSVAWLESEIDAWMQNRINQRPKTSLSEVQS